MASPAPAAQCDHKGGFDGFLADSKKEESAQGITQRRLAARNGIIFDAAVIAADRKQHVFDQSFEQFPGRMISKRRFAIGQKPPTDKCVQK